MRLGLVTGHAFGRAAALGAMSHVDSGVELVLAIGLSGEREAATSGFTSVEALAAHYEAPYIETTDGRLLTHVDDIRRAELDVLFVVGWSRLVCADVLELFPPESRRYAIGMHPTLLPEGRGRAPIPWTILRGLTRTGLSAFTLEPEADTGAIVAQTSFGVPDGCTSTELFELFEPLHAELGAHIARVYLAFGELPRWTQDEAKATSWPKRTPADSEIHDGMSFTEIERLIRASTPPYPGAFVMLGDRATPVVAVSLAPVDGLHGRTQNVALERSGVYLQCAADGV